MAEDLNLNLKSFKINCGWNRTIENWNADVYLKLYVYCILYIANPNGFLPARGQATKCGHGSQVLSKYEAMNKWWWRSETQTCCYISNVWQHWLMVWFNWWLNFKPILSQLYGIWKCWGIFASNNAYLAGKMSAMNLCFTRTTVK